MRKLLFRHMSSALTTGTAVANVVTVNSAPPVDFTAAGTYSWTGRAQLFRFNGTSEIAVLAYKATDSTSGFQILMQNGRLSFQERKTFTSWSSTQVMPFGRLNRWFDWVVTYDGTNQAIHMYMDGVELPSAIGSFSWANVANNTTGPLIFGKANTTENLSGSMCDLAMYSRVLTLAEITGFSQGQIPSSAQVYVPANDGFNAGTTLVDSSGNGSTVTCTNANMWSPIAASKYRIVPRPRTRSLSFNGSTNYATLPISPPAAGFSVGFWLFVPVLNSNFGRIFDYLDAVGGGNGTRLLLNTLVNKFLSFDCRTAGAGGLNGNTGSIAAGKWWHIVLTNDGAGLSLMYINGYQHQRNASSTYTLPNAQTFTLGRASNSSANFGNFLLSEFTFIPRTISQPEVESLYYFGKYPTDTTCFIDCDNNVLDKTGNGNSMTLVSGTSYSTNVPFSSRHAATSRLAA